MNKPGYPGTAAGSDASGFFMRVRMLGGGYLARMRRCLGAGTLALLATPAVAAGIVVGAFSAGELAGWEEKSFKGHTRYALVPVDGRTVLEAQTDGAASGRFRRVHVDLTQTPMLEWSWKIEAPYAGIDENARRGDDFPVRLYVVVERGVFGLSGLALNYVWAAKNPVGMRWPNPFSRQAMMLAVDSGAAKAGQWVKHRRNVREDLRAAFGEDITAIDAVAVMTDGDNSGSHGRAWYGDIAFSSE